MGLQQIYRASSKIISLQKRYELHFNRTKTIRTMALQLPFQNASNGINAIGISRKITNLTKQKGIQDRAIKICQIQSIPYLHI